MYEYGYVIEPATVETHDSVCHDVDRENLSHLKQLCPQLWPVSTLISLSYRSENDMGEKYEEKKNYIENVRLFACMLWTKVFRAHDQSIKLHTL